MNDQSRPANSEPPEEPAAAKLASLSDLLPPERIALDVRVATWQQAIEAAGQLLFETGAVTAEYTPAMVKVAQDLGPYIVIAPGIALPHARPEAGARQTALSFVRLAEPVWFGNADNDPVRLVFALAATDHSAHVLGLKGLAELFLSRDLMDRMLAASSREAIHDILREAESIAGN